jgi:hypothetical protein
VKGEENEDKNITNKARHKRMVLGRNKGGSTSVKEATGMKDRFDFIVVGNDKKLFYKDTFGAAAAGANYITNAFPFLYLATVEEMMRRIDAREVGKVSEKMMSRSGNYCGHRPGTGCFRKTENGTAGFLPFSGCAWR